MEVSECVEGDGEFLISGVNGGNLLTERNKAHYVAQLSWMKSFWPS